MYGQKGNGFLGKLNEGFLHFLPIFLTYLMTFSKHSAPEALGNFEILSHVPKNLAKSEEKLSSISLKNPFFG